MYNTGNDRGSVVMNEPLVFTDNAAAKVWELIQEEGNFNLKLRVYVTGGGCSGLKYEFKFDEDVHPDDTRVEKAVAASKGQPVQLLVDPMSLQYLIGAEIDYKEDVVEGCFHIRNPNASGTCGCGSSFSV